MENEDNRSEIGLKEDFPATSDAEWLSAAESLLKGKPFAKILQTQTYEGITLQPQYRKEVWERVKHIDELPGTGHYVRGSKIEGYQKELWKIAQEIPYATPEELNEALLYDLQRGQDSINIVLDKACLHGNDADEAMVDSAGRNGTSIATLSDLERTLKGIQLECVDFNIQAYNQSLEYAMLTAAYCEKNNIDIKQIRGCIGADPLGQLAMKGIIAGGLDTAYGKMAGLLLWGKEQKVELRLIDIHAEIYHNAGGSAVEETAFALATAVEYIRQMQQFNLSIDDIASKTQFTFGLGSNLFMEIAKLRAARILWSRIVEEFGGKADSGKMYIHGRTSKYNKTKYDLYVNMLRTTTEAFAGVIGGVDSMCVGAFDEIFRQPDEFSRRIARNQHLILAEESHLGSVTDAAGGSWYIEELTELLAEKVWTFFQQMQKTGSMSEMLISGKIQKIIEEKVKQRKENIKQRRDIITGLNMYANIEEELLPRHEPDYVIIEKSLRERIISERKNDSKIEPCAYSIKDAFLAGASIGYVTKALAGDTVKAVLPLTFERAAEPFEKLRDNMKAYYKHHGRMPEVFLANYGKLSQYKARADFSRGFFEAGGFRIIEKGGFEQAEAAAQAALKSQAEIVVICSTDADYVQIVPQISKIIKTEEPEILLILAGFPKDMVETYKQQGIDEFIHVRADILEIMHKAQQKTGVIK